MSEGLTFRQILERIDIAQERNQKILIEDPNDIVLELRNKGYDASIKINL